MELLARRNMPITGVAYAVGAESISAFTRGFRRFAGETPSQYRRRIQPL